MKPETTHVQTKEELERGYHSPDPWGYKCSLVDAHRKRRIIDTARKFGPFESALDIACGEAWITQDLPAKYLYGYECSDQAVTRWPRTVTRWFDSTGRAGPELVVITGALYYHYDYQKLIAMANRLATKYILTCNIAAWEVLEVDMLKGKQIHMEEFDYTRPEAKYVQRLRVFQI